jgi:CubicO group peptidase (beta-lactamase class C family)
MIHFASRMIHLYTIGALLSLHSCAISPPGTTEPEHPLASLLDSLLQASVMNQDIPGAAAYVSQSGNVLYHRAVGWRNKEKKDPLQKDDIFRMASMTKALTAVAVLQLVEQNLIDLDDELWAYIPEFENPEILVEVLPDSGFSSREAEGEITIRQLLTHTSGIGYGFQNELYNSLIVKNRISEGFEDDGRTSYENIRRLAAIPLLFEPGEKYVYGLSYDVLGVVIEKVSGMRFDRYIEKNILDPLGMKESYFLIPPAEQYRLVTVYQPKNDGSGLEPATYPDTAYPVIPDRQFFSGGSDLCSTAGDYAKFLRMLLNGGEYKGSRILCESSVEAMLSKQTPFDDGHYHQGFAAWVINEKGAYEGPRGVGSFEFGGFFDTFCWTDPATDLIAVLLLQMYPNNTCDIHGRFRDVIFNVIRESDH